MQKIFSMIDGIKVSFESEIVDFILPIENIEIIQKVNLF